MTKTTDSPVWKGMGQLQFLDLWGLRKRIQGEGSSWNYRAGIRASSLSEEQKLRLRISDSGSFLLIVRVRMHAPSPPWRPTYGNS